MSKVSEAIIGVSIGVGLAMGLVWLPPAPVHAQSSTWEVIAPPEFVGGVTLSIVRHIATKHCFVVANSGSSLSMSMDYGTSGLCDTAEEAIERKTKWERFVAEELLMDGSLLDQPSAPQTTKQPVVRWKP